ncbi:MAG: S9 family peptidase [Candidatus Bipolaricaulia bacterium]
MSRRNITDEDLLRFKFVDDPQMSPDGNRVIFTVKTVDPEKNRYLSHLWIADLETDEVRQFTHGEANDSLPRWSPDGRRIAFLRTRDKRTQIWKIPADGGEAGPLTQSDEGKIGAPVWSPDGNRIAFTFRPTHSDWTQLALKERKESGKSNPPRIITRLHYRLDGTGFLDLRQHIWICDAQTGEAEQITDGDYDDYDPVWSPGGKQIAYIGREIEDDPWVPRNDRLWAIPLQDGSANCLTHALDRPVTNVTISDTREVSSGGQSPIWSTDGTRLFFLASDQGSCHLYTVALDEGEPEPLTEGALEVAGFTIDREGERFAVLIGRPTQPPEVFVGSRQENSGLEFRPLSRLNTPWLEEVRLSEPEEQWFDSFDGTKIQGWLLKPAEFDPNHRYPFLLYIHGGPHAQYGNTFFHEFQVHVARGYMVFYINPRGSMGYEENFAACIRGNWGDVDFKDIMAAADFAESLPYVDSNRMAVAGGSYGGYMTNWIVGHTDRFHCAITDRSVVNLHDFFGTCDFPGTVDGYWPGEAWDRPENRWEQSPLRYAANIQTPLLIIHSEGDLRCPIEQADHLFVALKRLKRDVVFVRYPQETSHGLSRSGPPDLRVDRLQRIADWLDRHLKPS